MDAALDKSQWTTFFDTLSKNQQDCEAHLEIIGRAFGHQEEAAWMPFSGISYDNHHQQLFITVGGISGRYPVHLTHTIDHPTRVHVHYTSPGKVGSVLIVSPEKSETLLHLRQRAS